MFELGNRVRAMADFDGNDSIVGKCVKIIYIKEHSGRNDLYTVEFDDAIKFGHSGFERTGKNFHCWNVEEKYLELENNLIVKLI